MALDEENNRLLLDRLRGVADRRAHYVCVAAYVDGVRTLTRRGAVHGRVLEVARGPNGFGYDPLFFSDELGRTFGEASREEKEHVSHRGRAFRALLDALDARDGRDARDARDWQDARGAGPDAPRRNGSRS